MQKEIVYKLTNKTLPIIPALKNEKLETINMQGDDLVMTVVPTGNLSELEKKVGFKPNKITISADLMDDAACDVEVAKIFPKKMLKERSKFGYGRKSNVYPIREFLKIYKEYPLFFESVMMGEGKVVFVFNGKAKISVKVIITCSEIVYTFSE